MSCPGWQPWSSHLLGMPHLALPKLHETPLAAEPHRDRPQLPTALPCPPQQQLIGLAVATAATPHMGPTALP